MTPMTFMTPMPAARVFLPLVLAASVLAACAPANQAPPATTPETVEKPTKPVPPPKPKITAGQLLGQSDAWLLDKMGEPAFRRTDRHANLWQYKNGNCVLNVFLYAENPDAPGPTKVLHFDARTLDGGNTDRAHCLSVLQD